MGDITKRFHFLADPENQAWVRLVLDQDKELRRGERTRLDLALDFPDLLKQGPYDHIFYKVIRRSESLFARDLARDLRRNISRFARFERFWQARERAGRPIPTRLNTPLRSPALIGPMVLLRALG